MVVVRAAVLFPPSGSAPSGHLAMLGLTLAHCVSPNYAALHLTFLRSLNATSYLGVIARSRLPAVVISAGAPIAHVSLRFRFAYTSLAFGIILPRSSVGLASLRSAQSASFFGTIAFALVIFIVFPFFSFEIRGKTLFF